MSPFSVRHNEFARAGWDVLFWKGYACSQLHRWKGLIALHVSSHCFILISFVNLTCCFIQEIKFCLIIVEFVAFRLFHTLATIYRHFGMVLRRVLSDHNGNVRWSGEEVERRQWIVQVQKVYPSETWIQLWGIVALQCGFYLLLCYEHEKQFLKFKHHG